MSSTSIREYKAQGPNRIKDDLTATDQGPMLRNILKRMDGGLLYLTDILNGTVTGVFDHGSLSGLGDDDHPQYLLLTGRSTQDTVTGISTTVTPLLVKAVASSSVDAFTVEDSSANKKLAVDSSGRVQVNNAGGSTLLNVPANGGTAVTQIGTTTNFSGLILTPTSTGMHLGLKSGAAAEMVGIFERDGGSVDPTWKFLGQMQYLPYADDVTLNVSAFNGGTAHIADFRTTGLAGTIGSSILHDGTWSGPVASSSSVFVDSGFRISNSTPTIDKFLAFEVDGFTSATTRTLTPQDADYILAGTNIANTFVAGQTFFNSAPATPSLPAIIMQHSGGGTGDLLHLRSSGGVTNFLIDQTGLVWDWVPTSGQVTFQIGPGAFTMVDNSNRTMMSLSTGSTAYWSDAVSSGVYELFGANPDGKRVVIHNNGGIFSRLGFSATGFVIDNNASGVVHAPSSNGMVEIWNRANASKIALRLVLHPSQSAPGFVVRDSNDQKSYFSVGVLTNVGPSIFNNPFSGVGHGDTPIRIYVDTAADATNGLTYTMLDLYDVAGNQQMIWALDGAGAAGVLVFPTRGGLSVVSPAALTTGRVPFADANGDLTDDADLTFATDTLTVTKIAATTFTGNITLSTKNIVTDAATGTKIGTATTQLLGLWNAAPIAQPTTGIAASTFVTNTSLIANDSATWDGYTVGQVVKALRNFGLLA